LLQNGDSDPLVVTKLQLPLPFGMPLITEVAKEDAQKEDRNVLKLVISLPISLVQFTNELEAEVLSHGSQV
jgi:hypothetical protein